ncbi:RimI Acetyltransferases [Flavobacteriaceae bacterium]|jgi:ribosomal protein S18 acetylase RimI-like enzyme
MFEIKKADLEDLTSIQIVGKQSFLETFTENNTPENIEKYLQESFNTAQVTLEINNPESLFYLAFWENEPIGFLKVNLGEAQTESMYKNTLEIQRIYVLQAFHGKKIGQLLLDKAIEIAKQHLVDYVWLGVWEENHKALHFYNKNGFVTFDKHVFVLGDDKQTDLIMKLNTQN